MQCLKEIKSLSPILTREGEARDFIVKGLWSWVWAGAAWALKVLGLLNFFLNLSFESVDFGARWQTELSFVLPMTEYIRELPKHFQWTAQISRPPHAAAAGLLLWARRPGDIDQLLHAVVRRAASNAGSATLSTDVAERLVNLRLSFHTHSVPSSSLLPLHRLTRQS